MCPFYLFPYFFIHFYFTIFWLQYHFFHFCSELGKLDCGGKCYTFRDIKNIKILSLDLNGRKEWQTWWSEKHSQLFPKVAFFIWLISKGRYREALASWSKKEDTFPYLSFYPFFPWGERFNYVPNYFGDSQLKFFNLTKSQTLSPLACDMPLENE